MFVQPGVQLAAVEEDAAADLSPRESPALVEALLRQAQILGRLSDGQPRLLRWRGRGSPVRADVRCEPIVDLMPRGPGRDALERFGRAPCALDIVMLAAC